MAVHLSTLLILTGLTGICCVTTVSKVSVKAGDSVTIPCLYDREYINHVKGLCEGYYWRHCSFTVKTNQPDGSGRFSISDDKKLRIFTVTIKQLTYGNTDYWCFVEIDGGPDVRHYFHLSVNSTSSLYVDHQEVTGIIGENITINCHYSNTGEMRWCRLGKNCVTQPSGSIDGTRVTIDARPSKVFTVTMNELTLKSSGWYWCARGDFQMPVHVIVTEKPITTTPSDSLDGGPVATVTTGQKSSSFDPMCLIIRLSLLAIAVIVGLIVWFMLKHKQTKAKSSSRTMADVEITFSTVKHRNKTSSQTQEEATYCNVGLIRKNSPQMSLAESDVEVMESSEVAAKKE